MNKMNYNKMLAELTKSIESKKDVYVFSFKMTENGDDFLMHEGDNCVDYYALLNDVEMLQMQKDLYNHFLHENVEMDKLHIVLDIVQGEERYESYYRLFIFWDEDEKWPKVYIDSFTDDDCDNLIGSLYGVREYITKYMNAYLLEHQFGRNYFDKIYEFRQSIADIISDIAEKREQIEKEK